VTCIHAKLVASPEYIQRHGAPETPDDLLIHEALLQGTETWRLMDGPKIITVRPHGRFKADNAVALAAAAVAGLGIAKLPDYLIETYSPHTFIPVMTKFPVAAGGLYVVRPPGQHSVRKVRVLTDLLIQHFGLARAPEPIATPAAA
ncbi:MAG TPA: LysR substrate-binding domain-containing protein, partial [Steroidobacteraceae bacterium]